MNLPANVLTLASIGSAAPAALLARFGLELVEVEPGETIPGSYWGDSEAGIIGSRVYARADTPMHSLLHEAGHLMVMPPERRAAVHTDAGDTQRDEDAVCYLQLLLADELPGFGRERAFADMDAWGYTFRFGSAKAWFERDAEDAIAHLRALPHLEGLLPAPSEAVHRVSLSLPRSPTMRMRSTVLALSLAAACAAQAQSTPPANETADQFAARVNATFAEHFEEATSAAWLSQTYINADTARISALSSERGLARFNTLVEQAARFEGQPMSPATARTIALLKLGTSMPAPRDPAKLKELATIATRLDQTYGAGEWCEGEGPARRCQNISQITQTLATNRDYDAQLAAWQGWHTIAVPMRRDYQRFVELTNQGAREMGYANTGAMWRAGYDMPADAFAAETDRLWGQVQPLYEQLQCYTREKLVAQYGPEKGQVNGLLPAHLMGNLWQQDWGNLWPILQPYPNAASLDLNSALKKQRDERLAKILAALENPSAEQQVEAARQADLETATAMTKLAEGFYTGLGMPALPESFYTQSQLLRPRDRNVVRHASAWQMNPDASDVRIKMCIEPNEEELTTIYHELGHIYYYLAYKDQPLSFQTGAHDGFHEAIGDTIVLSMTPAYLQSIGLAGEAEVSREATINDQMRMALAKVAFMPFGLLIDRWRWGVFDGSITPERYNAAWWELKAKYQGVAPATPRGEEFFDAGAKYHVPGNTPYTRYFLSHVLQFQFYKSLCDAAGHRGPLHECSYANNPEAGRRYWAMMQKGASQPWQQTMKELTGGEQMDASAVLEYFAPLQAWLKEQNAGKTCGWPQG